MTRSRSQSSAAGVVVAWTATAIFVGVLLAAGVRLIMWIWP